MVPRGLEPPKPRGTIKIIDTRIAKSLRKDIKEAGRMSRPLGHIQANASLIARNNPLIQSIVLEARRIRWNINP